MLKNWLSTLEGRISLLIMFAMMPLAAFLAHDLFNERQALEARLIGEARQAAAEVVQLNGDLLSSAQQLLNLLALVPQVRAADPATCGDILSSVQRAQPRYATLSVLNARGDVVCSALPLTKPINAADRHWFQQALATRRFAIGDYQVGRVSGRPSLGLALPLMAASGKVEGIVYVALDLEWVAEQVSASALPDDSSFLVVDRNGMVLARYPDHDSWVGKNVADHQLFEALRSTAPGDTLRMRGLDDVERLFFRISNNALPANDQPLTAIGLSLGEIEAQSNRRLAVNLTAIVLLTTTLLVLCNIGGRLIITKPIQALVRLSRDIAAGNPRIHRGITGRFSEIDRLARDIETMAESLAEQRKALSVSEARYRAMIEDQDDMVVRFSADHRIIHANPAYCRHRGKTLDELVGTWVYADIAEVDRDAAIRHYASLSRDKPVARIEHRAMSADGEIRWQQWTDRALFDDEGQFSAYQSTGRDITDRKIAETAVQESQSLLRAVIDTVPAMVAVRDTEHRYVLVNQRHVDYDNRPIEWYAGKTPSDLYPEAYVAAELGREREVLSSGVASGPFEYEFVDHKGEVSYWLCNLTPVRDRNGAITNLVSVSLDITERRLREAALRESEARFRGAFESSPRGMALVSTDDRWIKVNRALCEITGYSEEELLEVDFSSITHSDDVALDLAYGRRLIVGEVPSYQMEKRYIHKNGQIVWVLLSVSLVRDDSGRPLYFVSQIFDLTEHKRAESVIRESEGRYRQLVEATGAVPYVWHVDSRRFLFVGPQLETLLGYPVESWTDEGFWADHIHPEDRDRQVEYARRLDNTETDRQDEYRMIAADGSVKWIRDVMAFGRDEGGRRVAFGSMFDETNSKQRDQQLAQAQKMEALGQLTGGVAHDFNNMLMVISGNLELMARRIGQEPRVQESLGLAREATRAAADLTNHLLAFARRQVLRPQVIDLAALMSTMRELLIRTLGERIECRFIQDDQVWPVQADRGQLQSALLNLALNARDAMPGGGRLTIAVANKRFDHVEAQQMAIVVAAQFVKISVSDSGGGMTADVMRRAFEPFFTTKGTAKGSGLGLSMVYGFVTQSGGHISIDSKPGAGTTIEILLPRAETQDVTGVPAVAEATRAAGAETILVVEDDARVRTTTVRMLEDLGYRVLEAPNGSTALETLQVYSEIDLLFSDVVMPGDLDGPALARKARELRPSLKLLLASGYAEEDTEADSPIDAEITLLPKPYSSDQLARTVRAILNAA